MGSVCDTDRCAVAVHDIRDIIDQEVVGTRR